MGISCYSLHKPPETLVKNHIQIHRPSLLLHYNSVPLLAVPNLERQIADRQLAANNVIQHGLVNQNKTAELHTNQKDTKPASGSYQSRPILPNLPYSPLCSPQVSPEHRLHPHRRTVTNTSINGAFLITGDASSFPAAADPTSFSSHHSLNSLNFNNHVPHRTPTFLGQLPTTDEPLKGARSVSVTEDSKGLKQLNQYNIRHHLGQGSYGLVQLAYNQQDSNYYALKILSKKKLLKSSGLFNRPPPIRKSTSSVLSSASNRSPQQSTVDPLQKIYREIAIHKKLNHPNITKLVEVLDDSSQDFLYLVFEYVENGPVMQIGKDEPFSEGKARKYFIDTLLGLEYLHYQKIIHRDIKPANLLVSSTDQIKIADFGVSNEFSGDDVYLTSSAGSPAFMAPESVRDGEQAFTGKALDIWALGITLYAFVYGKVPFEHFNRFLLYQIIINNPILYPETPALSDSLLSLLRQMLDKNPVTRIKIKDIKTHEWTVNGGYALPSESENCGATQIDVTEDEIANSISVIPRLETVIRIKMLLKNRSFRDPLRSAKLPPPPNHNIPSSIINDDNNDNVNDA